MEDLIHLGCSHPVLCAGYCKCWSVHRTECGEELSECFGGEEEAMSKSNGGVKGNINKASHNTTLKNLLEFSSAGMVSYIRVACQCDMQRVTAARALWDLHCCPKAPSWPLAKSL